MSVNIIDPSGNAAFTDVLQQNQSVGGLNVAVTSTLRGQTTATVQVSAIGSLTLAFEGAVDGTNFFALNAVPAAGGVPVTTTTATGQWRIDIAGLYQFRVRCSAYTSGTATVNTNCSQGESLGSNKANTDQSSQAGTAITTVPVAFGTGTPSGNAPGANAALFVGTTAVRSNQTTSATGVVDVNIVGSLGSSNSQTKGIFTTLTDQTTAISAAVSALGTAPTGTQVMAVNNVALPSTAAGAACTMFQNSAVTTAVVVKASAGNIYGFMVFGGTSGNFLQFINVASAPTLGTSSVVSFQIPASGIIQVTAADIAQWNQATGICVGISTTYNGAAAGTAAAVVVLYK